jgi:hypothetical protein
MARQISIFFLFISLILLIIFCGTAQAEQPAYGICVSGLFLFTLGAFIFYRNRPAPTPSTRFKSIRKYSEKDSKKKDPSE